MKADGAHEQGANTQTANTLGANTPTANTQTAIDGWTLIASGKVRDVYTIDRSPRFVSQNGKKPEQLLLVASDRISAFDHAIEPAIPHKGELLTQLSSWWFSRLPVTNHLLPLEDRAEFPEDMSGRSVVVKPLSMLPIECVVRGHLFGSAVEQYRKNSTVCGVKIGQGLDEGDAFASPIFTPAWKAPKGEHDRNIDFAECIELVGKKAAHTLREKSLELFAHATHISHSRGLICADTKFEFGLDRETGEITLADEVLTSDSSRFWSKSAYETEHEPAKRFAGFDKQIARDWLREHWDQKGKPPPLPEHIVSEILNRYRELYRILTGENLFHS